MLKKTLLKILECIQLQKLECALIHCNVTACSPFKESCTKLRELKYKLILFLKTVCQNDATCVVL